MEPPGQRRLLPFRATRTTQAALQSHFSRYNAGNAGCPRALIYIRIVPGTPSLRPVSVNKVTPDFATLRFDLCSLETQRQRAREEGAALGERAGGRFESETERTSISKKANEREHA